METADSITDIKFDMSKKVCQNKNILKIYIYAE